MFKVSRLSLTAIGFGVVVAGCGGSKHAQVRTEPTPPPAASAPRAQTPAVSTAPAVDPVQTLITESQQHYLKGQRELELGHLDRARTEFNAALDVLLNAPGGARTEPRLREQFDRLVDKISALEVAALATGDGFAEKPAEPASTIRIGSYWWRNSKGRSWVSLRSNRIRRKPTVFPGSLCCMWFPPFGGAVWHMR